MRQILELQAALLTSPPPPSTIDRNIVAVKLIGACCTLANLRHAALVFYQLCCPNLIVWNAYLKALAQHNQWAHTLFTFRSMLCQSLATNVVPDEYTFTSVIKACAGLLSVMEGEKAHGMVLRHGFQWNLFVQNSLVDMYFKLGRPDIAQVLFSEMEVKDVVSWNTMLSGYCLSRDLTKAREVFDGMDQRSIVSWSAMIAGYTRVGDLASARMLFDSMPERNVISWNAMIAGYSQNEMFAEAIRLFREMQRVAGVMPNDVTLVSVLSACANLGALDLGKWVDRFIKAKRMELNLFLGNALSDMYVKCGCVTEARAVFDKMPEKDVISWSIIISGLAMHGYAEEALDCFHEMLDSGIQPNDIVFMGILSACTHAGLVKDGLKYFDMMQKEFRIDPVVEHYGCMVDLLSRAGRLDEAERMIGSMQVPPNVIVWGALLGGCKIYKDVARGERAVRHILELNPQHSGAHVYLASVYSSMGKLEDAAACRLQMRARSVVKTPGCSWIEMNNTVHEFFVGDRSHPLSDRIYAAIAELRVKMRLAGYRPNTSVVSQNVDEEEKENALSIHSEKLALAFGLISSPEGTTIRIVKNLRVCTDCHEAMKVISSIVRREIVLRDRTRFHHFREGVCSCKDYW